MIGYSVGFWAIVLCFVGITAYLIFTRKKEHDEPTGRPTVEMFTNRFSEGHAFGVGEISIVGERTRIDFVPRIINYQKEMNKNKRLGIKKGITVKTYTIFFDNDLVDYHADQDTHGLIIKAYPSKIDQVPKGVLRTDPWIADKILMVNKNTDLKSIYESRLKNIQELAKYSGGGIMAKEIIGKLKESMKDLTPNKDEPHREDIKK